MARRWCVEMIPRGCVAAGGDWKSVPAKTEGAPGDARQTGAGAL